MVEIMTELTANDLKEKIDQVKKDIEVIRNKGDSGQKLDIMYEYIAYLEDELKMIERKY